MTQDVSNYFRFCPNQPEIRISDAVCSSRRRVRYPFCQGCQFNDDEKKAKERGESKPGNRQEAEVDAEATAKSSSNEPPRDGE